jgi:hypothetical protein
LSYLELLQPELDAVQGISAVGGIEEDERQIGIVKKERVDEPIIGLAGEVPKDGLTPSTILAACVQSLEHPELLAVGRRVFLELTVCQPPAEPRLAYPRVPTSTILALV